MSVEATSQNLSHRFRKALAQALPDDQRNLVIWRLIVGHPWYQTQLKRMAQSMARYQPASILSEDIEQEAVLFLEQSLKRCPDLQFDPKQPDNFFSRWMQRVIRHDCLEALRRLRRGLDTVPLLEDGVLDEWFSLQELRRDLMCCLEILPPAERFLIDQYWQGHSVEEAASQLNISIATAYRRFQRAIAILRQCLN